MTLVWRRKRMLLHPCQRIHKERSMHWSRVIAPLIFGLCLAGSGSQGWALSITAQPNHYTDNYAPHGLPNFPVGQTVQVFATVGPSAPLPTVTATQGGTIVNLLLSGSPTVLPGGFFTRVAFDPGLTGSWTINATEGVDSAAPRLTPPLIDPEFLPFVENITIVGSHTSPTITWTLPDLTNFDVDRIRVRAIEAITGVQIFESLSLSGTSTSFTIPTGLLTPEKAYVFRILLDDLFIGDPAFGTYLENRSNTFSAPFAAVPEPASWLLLATGCTGLFAFGWRHRQRTA